MKKYVISFDVEKFGPIEFEVEESTYKTFSSYCKKNYPNMKWETVVSPNHV